MKLQVIQDDGSVLPLELDGEMALETVKAVVEAETGLVASEQQLWCKGKELADSTKTLTQYDVADNDVIYLVKKGNESMARFTAPLQRPSDQESLARYAQQLIDQIKADPYQLSTVKANSPDMARAIEENNVEQVAAMLATMRGHQQSTSREHEELARRLEENPFDPEANRRVAEMIQAENVERNLMHAMEYNPEAFGSVHMLYIECFVNGEPVKAFVDSGAQATIISPECAERCNIMRLVDKRFQGVALGVGQAKIIGRIHAVDVKIGADFMPCSFNVIEGQHTDMLLGLDMLKRHQCCIDLKENILHIGTTGSTAPFLAEKDLPSNAKLNGALAEQDAKSAPQPQVDEESVRSLMALGYSREMAVQALEASKGNAATDSGLSRT